MNTCRVLVSAVLIVLASAAGLQATTITRASQAVAQNNIYDIQNLSYDSHSTDTISLRDNENGTVTIQVPRQQMAGIVNTFQTYRYNLFNIRLQLTVPYNARTRGCTGTYMSQALVQDANGSGTVALARLVARTGRSTVHNLLYLSHTASAISFSDTEGNRVTVTVPSHLINTLLNTILSGRNTRQDVTLVVTQPYNNSSRECTGAYRSHRASQAAGGQQTSSAATHTGTRTVNDASGVTTRGSYTIQNLTYVRHTQVYFYFRDSANNTIDILVTANQHQTLVSQVAANPTRVYAVTIQSDGSYNSHLRNVRGNYVSHTSAAANAGQQGNRNIRSLSEATATGEYTIASVTYVSVASGGLVYTFRDFDNNTLTLRMADVAQSDRLWDYLNSRNNPRASIRMRVTHPYNPQNRQCRGTYIAHY